jgi:hypothetical protein
MDGKEGVIENKQDYIIDNLALKQKNNKLKFNYSRRRLFIKNVHKYYFKMLYKTEDRFMVSPSSRQAKKYFNKRDSIIFKTKYHFADQTNSFTKIIFHSGRCFGWCDDLHLELDYSGNLRVTNNGHGVPGSVGNNRNDNYFGKVSYYDLERLKHILKYSQLKTLEWPESRRCFDAPDITLILYQHDVRYYFKLNGPCVPIVSWQLTRFLSRLFKYETLTKVDTTFTYEK